MKSKSLQKRVTSMKNKLHKIVDGKFDGYKIDFYISYDNVRFMIKNEKMNWKEFVDVKIYLDGKTEFSHGSGPWQEDFTSEEILDATIVCFNIAKWIFSKKEKITEVLKKTILLEKEYWDAIDNENNILLEKLKKAKTKELENQFMSITPKDVIELLRKRYSVNFIKIGQYDNDKNEVKTRLFSIINTNFRHSDKLKMTYEMFSIDNGTIKSELSTKTYIKDLKRILDGAFMVENLDEMIAESTNE